MTDTCGSYRTHGGCSNILMSEVLGESAGAFCVKMCVAMAPEMSDVELAKSSKGEISSPRPFVVVRFRRSRPR